VIFLIYAVIYLLVYCAGHRCNVQNLDDKWSQRWYLALSFLRGRVQ